MVNLVGKKTIDFNCNAVLSDGSIVKDFNFYKNIDNKYALLFFYPMDFTFVCPTELISINNRIDEFKSKNVEVIAVSIDSHYVHRAWKEYPLEKGGLGNNVSFTMVSDVKREIIKLYDVEDDISGVSYRASFLIDENKLIRVKHVNDFSIGRNIDEYLRLFDALIFNKKHGNVCEAGWFSGSKGLQPNLIGISEYLKDNFKKL